MNDTRHADLIERMNQEADRFQCEGSPCGHDAAATIRELVVELKGEGPHAPATRTTGDESGPVTKSAAEIGVVLDKLWLDGGDDYNQGWNGALEAVEVALEIHRMPSRPNDSGKSGAGASFGASDVQSPTDAGKSLYGADKGGTSGSYVIHKAGRGFYRPNAEGYTLDRDKAGRFTFAEADDLTHPNGRDGPRDGLMWQKLPDEPTALDPAPDEQAERFEAIKANPRPTAAHIKRMLDRLHAWRAIDPDGVADVAEKAAGMIDKLAVDLLAVEMDRDDLRRQLDTIAAQAKPIDGTDLAELVQRARLYAERRERTGDDWGAATAVMIRTLIGALNDQARKLAALEPVGDDMDATIEAARVAIIGSVAGKEPAEAWNLIASRLRYFLIEERKARRRAVAELEQLRREDEEAAAYMQELSDRLDTARALIEEAKPVVEAHERNLFDGWPYDDRQRASAAEVLRRWTLAPVPAGGAVQAYDDGVDAIARALGMRRADA